MANQLNQILQELYQLDPELKKYESDLVKIIKQIMATKPNTKFDKKFAKTLRARLLQSKKTESVRDTSHFNSLLNLFMNKNMSAKGGFASGGKKLAYALGGAVLTALVLLPLLNDPQTQDILNLNKTKLAFDTGLKIEPVGTQAFGPLSSDGTQDLFNTNGAEGTASLAVAPESAPVARDQSGGGSASSAIGLGGGGGVAVDAKMIAPDFISYKYVYKGEELALTETNVDVLKRVKSLGDQSTLSGLLSSFNLGLLNLGSFGQSSIENLTLTQSGRYGYMINIQPNEGFVSISKNWNAWPQLNCTDPNCDNLRIRENQIPSDDSAIKIANDFMAQHNISLSGYGSPEVQEGWRLIYEQALVKSDFWFPDTVNVIYPLEINGQHVYEQYGSDKFGLVVSIDVRENKVAGLSNLTNQNYQSSFYAAETDPQKILAVAERGGLNGGWWAPEGTPVQELELGTPTRQLIRYYRYRDNQTEELYVPALIFPIINRPDNAPVQQVVVPLASELLNEQNNGGPIRIMPEPVPLPAQTEPAPAAVEDIQELQ